MVKYIDIIHLHLCERFKEVSQNQKWIELSDTLRTALSVVDSRLIDNFYI